MAGSIPPAPRHGGDLAFAAAHYGEPAGGFLDLSTGINPSPYPAPPLTPAALARLPHVAPLVRAARRAYDIPDTVAVAAAPGSELAIRLLPLVAPPGTVAIICPTYGSHAESWKSSGRQVTMVGGFDEGIARSTVVVVGNPNNPDGRVTTPDVLAAGARQLGLRGGLLVVDEAFADTAPELSLVPHLAGLSAIVLRSLGKFYGLPGLRLGFAIGEAATIERLAALLGDWPVSGPAVAIATAALADEAWRERTRTDLRGRSAKLCELLARHELKVAGATSLFALVKDDGASALHEALARNGVWTRAFAELPTCLRFGLPASDADFARLDAALRAVR